MVLETVSVSHGKASAYLPVIDLLRNYFRIANEDDARTRREKVNGKVLTLDRALEDTIPYLFSLLGIVEGDDPLTQMDGQIKKRRTLEAIKRILLRESLNQPLMVIFEDLHWIDEQTQELLNLLVDSIGTAKFLLLVNYRPEYSHQWNSKTYYTQLRTRPARQGERRGDALGAVGRRQGSDTTQAAHHRTDRGHALLHGGDSADPLRRWRAPAERGGEARQVDERSEGPRHRASRARLAYRPAFGGGEGVAADPGGAGTRISARAGTTRDAQAGRRLGARLSRLQAGEFIYEQLAAGDVEYTLKHALTQEVAYNALLVERRKLLHERAGQALESMFAEQLEDHLDELAHHYSRSDNVAKAVEYLGRAGQQALQRSAYADAISSLSVAINLLRKLPDDPEPIQRELLLQLAIARALIPLKSRGAPEVERAYTRARELCERVGDPPELFPVLFGLWTVQLLRGELRGAYELAEQLLRRAKSPHEPGLLLYARYALGNTSFWLGELLRAREHLEMAISLYDRERHWPLTFRYGGGA
jgi:tetratricopeptide (TPR) repeat protein